MALETRFLARRITAQRVWDMHAYAGFFDMLGSSAYFEQLPDDHDFENASRAQREYADARKHFREVLEFSVEHLPATELPLTAGNSGVKLCALFSDCAYVISHDAVLFAHHVAGLMRSFINRGIPVRGGVGFGNFGFDRTATLSLPGGFLTEASFFGSAIVRAHRAEACGLKGFRIFVHSSAVAGLTEHIGEDRIFPARRFESEEDGRPPELPGVVVRMRDHTHPQVTHELCWIGHQAVDDCMGEVERIKRAFPPDERSEVHYLQTMESLHHFDKLRMVESHVVGSS